ncbi:hypothetical protein GCM10012319_35660 [Comamonas sp. KCTC 72670]|nr:hypothetical protein GCM10012319_35660 [Comamonas sp. KCTC 72670]
MGLRHEQVRLGIVGGGGGGPAQCAKRGAGLSTGQMATRLRQRGLGPFGLILRGGNFRLLASKQREERQGPRSDSKKTMHR